MNNFTKTINISIAGLHNFLFKKKKCPYCNHKLIRKDKNELVKKGWIKNPLDFPADFSYHYGNHHKKEILFYCNCCCKPITLKEISKSK